MTLFVFKIAKAGFHSDTIFAKKWEFVENKGQLPNNVKFDVNTRTGRLFFEKDGYTVVQYSPQQLQQFHESKPKTDKIDAFAYKVSFQNCKQDISAFGEDLFQYHYNYFRDKEQSNWAENAHLYGKIQYTGIYDNINLRFYSLNGYLKYDFVILPGGITNDIQMRYSGQNKITKSANELIITTSLDRVLELKPFAYQIDNQGDTIKVDCSYKLNGNIVSFDVGDYDKNFSLIIDPTLIFSTFSGSTADNWGYTATYDKHGNLYGGGISFNIGYPTTLGAYQVDFSGGVDVTISKFNASGSSLLYSTYLGGDGPDIPHSLFVNHNDELYVFGTTGSVNFPVTPNSFDTSFNGGNNVTLSTNISFSAGSDIFVSKFSANGSQLLSSTFVGGTGNDGLNTAELLRKNYADDNRGEIIVDESSNVYVVTSTFSADFPTTNNCFQSQLFGGQEVCVFKLSQDLSSMIWSSYFGGEKDDAGYSMFIAADGSVYICGGTTSTNLSVSTNAYQIQHADSGVKADGFVAHISQNGNNILQATYIGKEGYDQAYLIENGNGGYPCVFGQTEAQGTIWVNNANYYVPSGGQFLAKLHKDLQDVVWSTAFGTGNGGPDISPTALMADYCNNIYLSGWGSENLNEFGGTSGLPVTADAYQTTTDGNDFYFMTISDDASNIVYASFFGGATREHVDGGTSRFDKKGCIYQAVCAGCGGNSSFPTTIGAYSNHNGSSNCNLGVIKMDFNIPSVVADFTCPKVVCLPDTVFFENISQTSNESVSVNWDFGDGSNSTEWNAKHNYNSSGLYTITLIVTDELSCNYSDTMTQQIYILSNSTNYLPTMRICTGDFVELGLAPSPNVDYSWTPETSLNNPAISNPIATPEQSTLYTLVASFGGCIDTLKQFVDVHTLDVNISASLQDTSICIGDNAILSINVITLDQYNIYWSENADFHNVIAFGQTTLTVSPNTNTTYYVKVETNYCTQIYEIHVNVIDLKISGEVDYLLCFTNEVSLETNCSGGLPPYQYLWEMASGETSSEQHPTFEVLQTSNYSVTITDSHGCSIQNTGTIIVQEGTFLDEPQTWCKPEEVIAYHPITLFATDYGDNYNYQWSPNNDMTTPNEASTIVVPTETTTYTVKITDSFGCTKTVSIKVTVIPISCDNPFVFVPNSFTPNGDGVNDVLYVRSDIIKELYFVIYNRWGEKIFETNQQSIGWDGKFKNKECQRGAYDYYLKCKCIDGDEKEMKGSITLIR